MNVSCCYSKRKRSLASSVLKLFGKGTRMTELAKYATTGFIVSVDISLAHTSNL